MRHLWKLAASLCVAVFLATAFSAEPRHERRIAILTEYERSGQLPSAPAGG